jgi:putative acetyltransferase
MRPSITIRAERETDHSAIDEVLRLAFEGMPYAEGDEAELVRTLRCEGALFLSLLAELDGEVVGHIAFSPARTGATSADWFALGPLAVLPQYQHSGLGSKLVKAGLDTLSGYGAAGCILVGHPQYYTRFGFIAAPELAPPGQPAEFFFIKLLCGELPGQPIDFHEAFGNQA